MNTIHSFFTSSSKIVVTVLCLMLAMASSGYAEKKPEPMVDNVSYVSSHGAGADIKNTKTCRDLYDPLCPPM